ncbi:MAG: hypothetical protein JSW52_01625 [Candidatus Coatesbacteria bacterium]|nr:MAG: hypothetical protein JSW52_01625 [Candidatus Coatesbacteria bacterium]
MEERIRTKIPDEVRLVAEVMSCYAVRCFYDYRHPCSYFKRWGRYPSYDWATDAEEDELRENYGGSATATAVYAGRRYLVPELLSGCRKAPIMMAGLNPNLPTFFKNNDRYIYPYFDDIFQYAYHFRYRTAYKREITKGFFEDHKTKRLYKYPAGYKGDDVQMRPRLSLRRGSNVETEISYVRMYLKYAGLIEGLRQEVGLPTYGETIRYFDDFSYYNMVACPSPRWDAGSFGEGGFDDEDDKQSVTDECLRDERRGYFYFQFLQSKPKALVVFGNSMRDNIIPVFDGFFLGTAPERVRSISKLMKEGPFYIQITEGDIEFKTRLIFSYHASGAPAWFNKSRPYVIDALAEEYSIGNIRPNTASDGFLRTPGRCFYCDNSLFRAAGGCVFKDAFEEDVDATARALATGTAPAMERFVDRGISPEVVAADAASGDGAAISPTNPAAADRYVTALTLGEYGRRVTRASTSDITGDNEARAAVVGELRTSDAVG